MVTEARIAAFEAAVEANPEFIAKIKAAAAQPGEPMTQDEFVAWLAGL